MWRLTSHPTTLRNWLSRVRMSRLPRRRCPSARRRLRQQRRRPTNQRPTPKFLKQRFKEENKVAITAKDVQALRQATGVGILDAKKALEANDGNMEEAIKWLRVHGKASEIGRASCPLTLYGRL